MSNTYAEPLTRLEECLDEIGAVDPGYRTAAEKQELLVGLARAKAKLQAIELATLAVADDVAEATGARSAAAWLADETRDAHGRIRHDSHLATALDQRWTQVATAFRAGVVNLAQVRVIDKALTDLPEDLGEDLLVKAEAFLLDAAAAHGPRDLAVLGTRVLEYLAPEIADAALLARLEAEEARADATTRLTFRRRGDGTTDLHARLPDHAANRLRAYTDAIANPHRPGHADDFMSLPLDRRRGIAMQSLLETVLESDLPVHGATATSIVVTTTYQELVSGVGTATTSTGDTLSAEQLRRLACTAGIMAAVLGGKGEILDLGRTSRLFKGPIRKAMDLRDKECTTRGCHVPAAYCHAHHFRQPWAQGGHTKLEDGKLLCPFHHGRAHHPKWNIHHHSDGSTTFTRRL